MSIMHWLPCRSPVLPNLSCGHLKRQLWDSGPGYLVTNSYMVRRLNLSLELTLEIICAPHRVYCWGGGGITNVIPVIAEMMPHFSKYRLEHYQRECRLAAAI
jgi:hypothetical protein